MHIMKHIAKIVSACFLVLISSCEDYSRIESQIEDLENRVDNLEIAISTINNNAISAKALLLEHTAILGVTKHEKGYTLELSDGTTIEIVDGLNVKGTMPIIGIDEKGNWIVSYDNGATFDKIEGYITRPDAAATPMVRINEEGYWEMSTDEGESWGLIRDHNKRPISAADGKEVAGVNTFFTSVVMNEETGRLDITLADGRSLTLDVETAFYFNITGHFEKEAIFPGEIVTYTVESNEVAEVAIVAPDGWEVTYSDNLLKIVSPATAAEGIYEISVIAVSNMGFIRNAKVILTMKAVEVEEEVKGYVQEWQDFVNGREANVLLDFSYAGYKHGELEPQDAFNLGYRVYMVTNPKYGAIPDDGKSDREAFIKALTDALGEPKVDGNNCISFPHKPEANAVIYFPEGEYILHDSTDDNLKGSQSILIQAGHFAIKGDGRGKTVLVMGAPMQPTNPLVLYSSPDMIQLKHNSTFSSYTPAASVISNSAKGAFSVKVTSAAALNVGEWVCLHMKNNSAEVVAAELYPYEVNANWDIAKSGVEVIDYHQIKQIKGNEVFFHEPLHHEVAADAEWEIKKFPHYEYVGVEDLTFRGFAKNNFVHHGSWMDDGAYKPLSMNRVTDSWIRRVGFESVSEACSIINSANVSTYDIQMTGVRGHAAVRSQASSRVLIAATTDETSEGAGNWHGVGVSRNSIGTVLWRNTWGDDSCFESHATQPRATLIDCCTGGWHRSHQGGDSNLAPHHLADLTIWNFKATNVSETDFVWWGSEAWWKFLPPVIVGFQSAETVTFRQEDTKVISSQNSVPDPESLYEAQLQHRLGYVPAWLNALK